MYARYLLLLEDSEEYEEEVLCRDEWPLRPMTSSADDDPLGPMSESELWYSEYIWANFNRNRIDAPAPNTLLNLDILSNIPLFAVAVAVVDGTVCGIIVESGKIGLTGKEVECSIASSIILGSDLNSGDAEAELMLVLVLLITLEMTESFLLTAVKLSIRQKSL